MPDCWWKAIYHNCTRLTHIECIRSIYKYIHDSKYSFPVITLADVPSNRPDYSYYKKEFILFTSLSYVTMLCSNAAYCTFIIRLLRIYLPSILPHTSTAHAHARTHTLFLGVVTVWVIIARRYCVIDWWVSGKKPSG